MDSGEVPEGNLEIRAYMRDGRRDRQGSLVTDVLGLQGFVEALDDTSLVGFGGLLFSVWTILGLETNFKVAMEHMFLPPIRCFGGISIHELKHLKGFIQSRDSKLAFEVSYGDGSFTIIYNSSIRGL